MIESTKNDWFVAKSTSERSVFQREVRIGKYKAEKDLAKKKNVIVTSFFSKQHKNSE